MKITLIQVPYHFGLLQADTGTGQGPGRYLDAGAVRDLGRHGFDVTVEKVRRKGETDEIKTAVAEANADLASRVAGALAADSFPLVLAGACSSCLGTLAGLNGRAGIIWFDAHGDFNTPETSPSGFFEGMPLAIAAGLSHHDLWGKISSSPTVPPAQILLAGVRDLDAGEEDNIRESGAQVVTAAEMKTDGVESSLQPRLAQLRSQVGGIYLHFDIDALDPEFAPGVDFSTPGGLSPAEAEQAIRLIASQFRIDAAALTAYNPDREENDRTLNAGLQVLEMIAGAVAAASA